MLHTAYVQVADGLPGNAAAQINDGKLKLGRLGKADEPALCSVPPDGQVSNVEKCRKTR